MLLPDYLTLVAAVVGPAGAAWTGVRVALNGTRERVHRIENKVDRIEGKVSGISERTAKLEVMTDGLR